jgi:hypothetical protein
MRTALFRATAQRVVVIPYRRFGKKPIGPIFEGQEFLGFLTLEMVRIGCPEISLRNYHCSLRNSPRERSSYLLRSRSLKSRTSKLNV